MPAVQSVQHLNELFDLPLVVLLKHSLTCPISAVAYTEVAAFFADRPKIPACRSCTNAPQGGGNYRETHRCAARVS